MFVPETVMTALFETGEAFMEAMADSEYLEHLEELRKRFVGRPTPLFRAERLTAHYGGATVLLKREDLAHTGAHKINNTLGQALLAVRMGKSRIIAETGAGQHGVAAATAAALTGLECVVHMGTLDMQRQALNVERMRLLGARVVPVDEGSRSLKDAINSAIRDWVTNVEDSHYIIGSVVGPHPYPLMVRELQCVIGRETRRQAFDLLGRLPDMLVACVGAGSNALGFMHPFLDDSEVSLVGVEAGGEGLETGRHAATLATGRPGVLHGSLAPVLEDASGQIRLAHSIAAGLDYPGVGPEHGYLRDIGRVRYVSATDDEALSAFMLLCSEEGIIPALESAHALAFLAEEAPRHDPGYCICVCLSGRGDKDVHRIGELLPESSPEVRA